VILILLAAGLGIAYWVIRSRRDESGPDEPPTDGPGSEAALASTAALPPTPEPVPTPAAPPDEELALLVGDQDADAGSTDDSPTRVEGLPASEPGPSATDEDGAPRR
jgi:hypothetical protein